MEAKGIAPESKAQEVDGRVIDWPSIDQGRSRADRNDEIANDNALGRPVETLHVPAAGQQPAAPVQDLAPQMMRQSWADLLRGLADDAAKPLEVAPELRQEAHREPEPSPARVAEATAPEATQQPEKGPSRPSWLQSARDRLAALGDRLEAAFARVVGRDRPEPAPERPPQLERPQPAKQRDELADLLGGLSESEQKVRDDMQRAKVKEPDGQQESREQLRGLFPDYSKGRQREGPGYG